MLCKEIIEKLEELYPSNAALTWDNVGLLVGRKQRKRSKIHRHRQEWISIWIWKI